MIRLIVGLVCASLLAACSGGKTAADPAATHSASAPASTSPSPTATTATVAQWGSLVASRSTPVKAAAADLAGCPIEDLPGDIKCGLGHFSFSLNVETFGIYFEGAQTSSQKGYLGEPPTELNQLIMDTNQAIIGMKATETARSAACTQLPANTACIRALISWAGAKEAVLDAIAGWSPYTS
jgi:hypothetical protein